MGTAMYTAMILVCLAGEEQNNANCEFFGSPYKYTSKQVCWQAVNEKVEAWNKNPDFGGIGEYIPADARCVQWFDTNVGV